MPAAGAAAMMLPTASSSSMLLVDLWPVLPVWFALFAGICLGQVNKVKGCSGGREAVFPKRTVAATTNQTDAMLTTPCFLFPNPSLSPPLPSRSCRARDGG